jgi:hypothetical protein
MASYLKVYIEGKFVGTDTTVYEKLDDLTLYSPEELEGIAQDIVNNEYSWGHEVVDESEVPEEGR